MLLTFKMTFKRTNQGVFVHGPQLTYSFVHKMGVFVEKPQLTYPFVHQIGVFVEKLQMTYLFVHQTGVFVEKRQLVYLFVRLTDFLWRFSGGFSCRYEISLMWLATQKHGYMLRSRTSGISRISSAKGHLYGETPARRDAYIRKNTAFLLCFLVAGPRIELGTS